MSDTYNDRTDAEARDDADLNAEAGLDADPADAFEQDDDLGPIDALIAERDEWKDRALRAVAEAENTKRRAEREMNDARAYAIHRSPATCWAWPTTCRARCRRRPRRTPTPPWAGLVTGLEMTEKSLLSAFEAQRPEARRPPRPARSSTPTCIRP